MKPRHLQQLRRYPRHAIWEITRACNLRCIHCEGSAGARGQDELTTDEALALCDALISMGCEQCNISGGEPLLRKDWPMLCKRLSHGGVRVTIVTNGTFLDDSAIDQAERAGVRGVAMSLDGLRDTHGRIRPQPKGSSFDDVAAALRRVRASCMAPAIITHINRWNFAELEGIHASLGIWGVDHWQLQLGLPLGRQLEIDQPYMISREQLRALGPRLTALIQSGASPRLRITDTIGYFDRCEPVLRRSSSGKSGFYTVRHFIEGETMPGAGVLNICEWRSALLAKQMPTGVTPLEIAATLDASASRALQALPELRRAAVTPAANAKEYAATLGDIEAMSYLGLYLRNPRSDK